MGEAPWLLGRTTGKAGERMHAAGSKYLPIPFIVAKDQGSHLYNSMKLNSPNNPDELTSRFFCKNIGKQRTCSERGLTRERLSRVCIPAHLGWRH